ncbi:MAG: serine hydrolase domain-containing protein [Anaerolineae bacterium]
MAGEADSVQTWIDETLADLPGYTSAAASVGDPPAPHQDISQQLAAVEACMVREMRDRGIAGASMAIAIDGELAHTRAFGVKSRAGGEAVDTGTYFRVNSTTKTMTAAAVMKLVEDGRLDLHAPITEYVPELRLREPWQASDLTLHDLLTNAGAAPDPYLDYTRFPLVYDMPAWDMDLGTWAAGLRLMHLYAPPGSFWNYSSPNFSLAALPIESVTGREYGEFVATELWRPAGMDSTTFDVDEVLASGDYAYGHYGEQTYDPADYDRVYAWPAGGAYSTPTDLVKWAQVMLEDGGVVLEPDSVEAMTTGYVEAEDVPWTPLSHYGYGVFVDEYEPIRGSDDGESVLVYNHPGNGRGYATELHWAPERRFAIAILMNEYASMPDTVACALRELESLRLADVPGTDTPVSRWGRYAGTYSMIDPYGDTWTARVARTGRGIQIEYTDWSMVPAIDGAVDPQRMSLSYLDTFTYGGYGDNTVTFEFREPGDQSAGWMRSRYKVGQRVGDLPASLEITGSECETLQLTSGLDAPELQVRAYGLGSTLSLRDQRAYQDDPNDPSSSRIKAGMQPRGDVGWITAWLFEESDDNLELYLMQDQDLDGVFAWPDDLVDRLTSDQAQGLLVGSRDTPGPYQLWVHGETVNGAASRFALDIVFVSGDDLRLVGAPTSASDGQRLSFDVCGPEGAADAEPRVGLVELDFGVPSSVVRVPVYWQPAAVATATATGGATPTGATPTGGPGSATPTWPVDITRTPGPTPEGGWAIHIPLVLQGR